MTRHRRPRQRRSPPGPPRGSPPTSVTSAASIATSAPVPMAIPRSAVGERRRVVDAVADHGHDPAAGLEPLDRGRLVGRQHARPATRSGGMPTCAATASAVAAPSPVTSHDLDAGLGQLLDRRGRGRLDGIADRDEAGRRAVDGDEATVRPGAGRPRRPRRAASTSTPRSTSRRRLADQDGTGRWPSTTSPRRRARRSPRTPRPCGEPELVLVGPGDDRAAERVLAAPLERRRRGRAPRRSSSPAPRSTSTTVGPAERSACRSCRARPRRPAAAVSSASPPRIRMPASAPRPVPTMIAVGVARPIAHGQAMISDADERGQRERQPRLRAERRTRRRT